MGPSRDAAPRHSRDARVEEGATQPDAGR